MYGDSLHSNHNLHAITYHINLTSATSLKTFSSFVCSLSSVLLSFLWRLSFVVFVYYLLYFKPMKQVISPSCSQLQLPKYFAHFRKYTDIKKNNGSKILIFLKLLPFTSVTYYSTSFPSYPHPLFILLINWRI